MSSEGRRTSSAAAGLWPPPPQAWVVLAGVGLIYAGHLLYGGIVSDVALSLYLVAALLVGGSLIVPGLRTDLVRLKGLGVAGLLFSLVLAAGVLSLTPYGPGGAHPVWSYVDQPGAASIDRSTTIVELIKLLGLGCVFLLGAAAGGRDERARFAVQLMVVAGAIFGLWAIVAAATGAIYQTQGHRLEAHFLYPNTAGNVFAALFVLAVASLARALKSGGRRSPEAYVLGLCTLILAVALLHTVSRGGTAGALLALVIFFVLQLATGQVRASRILIGGFAGLALLLTMVLTVGDGMIARFAQAEAAATTRYMIWQAHWETFLRSPMLGYGLGNFEPINRSLLNASNFEALAWLRNPLHLYLQWLVEGGLLMAVPMFLCVAWLIWVTLRGLFRRSRMTTILAGLIALDATFIAQGFTDSALHTPSVAAFWAWALGLQVALAQGSSRR